MSLHIFGFLPLCPRNSVWTCTLPSSCREQHQQVGARCLCTHGESEGEDCQVSGNVIWDPYNRKYVFHIVSARVSPVRTATDCYRQWSILYIHLLTAGWLHTSALPRHPHNCRRYKKCCNSPEVQMERTDRVIYSWQSLLGSNMPQCTWEKPIDPCRTQSILAFSSRHSGTDFPRMFDWMLLSDSSELAMVCWEVNYHRCSFFE